MKMLLLLMIFVLSMPVVIGASSQTTMLYPVDSIHFEGYNIYIQANTDYTTLRVQIDDYVDFISTGFTGTQMASLIESSSSYEYSSSPRVRYGPLTIQLQQICADITEKNCARLNPNNNWIEPGYELFFSLEESAVKVTKKFSETSVWLDEEITLDISVENDGDVDITDFTYVESFPLGIDVIAGSMWKSEDSVYEYSISKLEPGDVKTFSLRFSLSERGEYSLAGEYSYVSQGSRETDFTSTSTVELQDAYSISLKTDKSTYELGDTGKGTITISPTLDREVNLDLELTVPSGIKIKKTELEQKGSLMYLSRTLAAKDDDEDQDEDYEFTFIAGKGSYDLFLFSNATANVPLPVQVTDHSITYGVDDDELDFQINSDKESILEGESARIELFLPGSDEVVFTDITFSVNVSNDSTISGTDFFVAKLDDEQDNIFLTFRPKIINETRSEEIVVTGSYSYESEFDFGIRNISASKQLKVYIPSDALKITRSVSPNPVEHNTTTVVKVEIENLLDDRAFDIFAIDFVPEDLLFKSVRTSTELSLRGGDKKLLYSYQLLMPFFLPNDTKVLTRISFSNFTFEEYTDLSSFVQLKKPSLTISSSWSSLVAGKPSELKLSISNTGDLKMNRVSLSAPLFQNIDLVSERNVFIPDLDPGESASLFLDYFVKAQAEEGSRITSIVAIDEYGNYFNLNDSAITAKPAQGSGCGVTGSLSLDSYKNTSYSLALLLKNTCDSIASITVLNPSLLVDLQGGASKLLQFSRKSSQDVLSGIEFTYSQDGIARFAKSNDLDLVAEKAAIDLASQPVSTTKPPTSPDSSSETSSSNSKDDSSDQRILVSETSGLGDIGKKLFGIFGLVALVFIFMTFLLKFAHRKATPKKPGEEHEEFDDSLVPPSIKEDLGSVGNFVDESLRRGIPSTRIEEQLHYVGWSKEIIDKYMVNK